MTLAFFFFNNLRLKHGGLFQFENNQFYLVAIRPNSWKNTKSLGSHRLFTLSDAAIFCSNFPTIVVGIRHMAISQLLFLMQRVMDYLLALQDFDFCRFFGHKRSITSKSKEVAHTIITLPEAKRFMFLSCLPFSFLKRVSV